MSLRAFVMSCVLSRALRFSGLVMWHTRRVEVALCMLLLHHSLLIAHSRHSDCLVVVLRAGNHWLTRQTNRTALFVKGCMYEES